MQELATHRVRVLKGALLGLGDFPLDGRGKLYEQLARLLKRAIEDGQFRPGERLPATRALAQSLGLSRNTVLTAYEILRAEQLTTSLERSVTRVSDPPASSRVANPRIVALPQSRYAERLRSLPMSPTGRIRPCLLYDLHFLPPSGPDILRSWSRKLTAAARVGWPKDPDPQGFLPLRRAIVEYLARRSDVECGENEILVVGGTQQAVTIAARALLNEGDTVAIEDPHCPILMQTLAAHGARVAGVRTDTNGMVPAELAPHDPRLIFVSPSDQFPSGMVMSLERRMELLDVATRSGSWIVEVVSDSEFLYRRRSIATLRSLDVDGRVLYAGTFSKTLLPALRLGFIVCPPGIREDLCRAKLLDDLGNSSVEEAALAAFMQSRHFDQHLRHTFAQLGKRRKAFLEALRRHGKDRLEVQDTRSGTHIVAWLTRLPFSRVPRLVELGIERSLGLYPIESYYLNPPERPGLILGYAGLSVAALWRAAELLGECLDELEHETARLELRGPTPRTVPAD